GFEVLRAGGEALGPARDLRDRGGAAAGGVLDRADLVAGARIVAGDGLHAARDLARGAALLLDRGRDGGRNFGHLLDHARDRGDFRDRALGRVLDGGDLLGDVVGRARGLIGSALTSEATTAKPLPASPARAASLVAFSASRLGCDAIAEMSPTTEPI